MRVLWLKTELLHPVDKGGKIRTYQMLKEMKRASHHITYLTLDDGTAAADARERATDEYCSELVCVPHRVTPKFSARFYGELVSNLASPLPYFMKKYESPEMRREIERCISGEDFDVMVCDFLMPAINVPARVENDKTARVLFQHNVEAMIWRRHFETQADALKRLYLKTQWRKTARYERAVCRSFDTVVAVSREDAEMMRSEYEIENVTDIPTGVDTEYFSPRENTDTHEPYNLVFTGSMDWLPNEDAINFFTTEIWPLIRNRMPATLTVVGRNPRESLIELSKRDDSITITGRVEDVRPYMRRAAAYIVPIRIGGGTRLKIYEAMASGLPVVSTTIGAEGLPVTHEEELLLADTPEGFADEVVRVLTDKDFASELSAYAVRRVRAEFSWARVAESFCEACESAVMRVKAESQTSRQEEPVTEIMGAKG